MSIAALLEAAEYLDRRERGTFFVVSNYLQFFTVSFHVNMAYKKVIFVHANQLILTV